MPYLCAGRQIAPSCVDADESLSAIGLHVEVAAASPAQEELQFCLTAAQQPRPHCSSVSHRIGISPKVPLHRAGFFLGFGYLPEEIGFRFFRKHFLKVSFGKVVPVRVFQNSGPEFETRRRTRVGSTWLCGQKCNG